MSLNCPGRHGLKSFFTPTGGFGCDVCKKSIANNAKAYGCR